MSPSFTDSPSPFLQPGRLRSRRRWTLQLAILLSLGSLICIVGCRATAPIHVWSPPLVATPPQAKVALAPVAGGSDLALRIERELLAQRPAASADVALFTAEQLAERSPIRLASTSALTSDLTALKAAEAVGADILLQGEILAADLNLDDATVATPDPDTTNMNQVFFQRLGQPAAEQETQESLLLSWRIIDVATSQTLDAHVFTIKSAEARLQYPDLSANHADNTDLLIAASARETWKSLAPVVVRDEVRLAVPYLQPGAWGVRRGVRAAKRGEWQEAEKIWTRVVERFGFQAAAHHNLAIAKAAHEDFAGAKQQLQHARGLLALRLPNETLFWLDQQHRRYHSAHGLARPKEGWAFPEPVTSPATKLAPPVDIDDPQWWKSLPFSRP